MTKTANLENKPLIEAVFELRWGLEGSGGPAFIDPSYQLLVGQLYGELKSEFPYHVALPVSEMPHQMFPYAPHHQFRAQPGGWPLVQFGPGILTVNETELYSWERFHGDCQYAIESLFKVSSSSGAALKFVEVSLRYINAHVIDQGSALEFLSMLKVDVNPAACLFDNGKIDKQPVGLGLALAFNLSKPRGTVQLVANQGRKGEEEAVAWENHVISRVEECPQTESEIKQWVLDAHEVTHEFFLRQIEGSLKAKFE